MNKRKAKKFRNEFWKKEIGSYSEVRKLQRVSCNFLYDPESRKLCLPIKRQLALAK